MAITQSTIRNSNGITFTIVVDSSSDWSGVTNSTYFKDLSDGLIYYKNSSGTIIGLYDTFTGGTVNGLTATTISATTYQNLPVSGLTAGNNINISGSNGNFTISVTGVTQGLSGNYLPLSGGTVTGSTQFTNGLTATTISATTYQNLPTDVNVTGGTYSAGTITFTNNTGGTFNVTGLTTGSTSTISGDYLPLSGGTVTGQTFFASGVTISGDTNITDPYGNMSVDTTSRILYNNGGINTINWDSGLLYDYNTTLTSVDFTNRTLNDSGGNLVVDWVNLELLESTNVSINWSSRVLSDINAGPSVEWGNRKLYKSGGTISFDWENGILTGQTNIQSSTISATTYQNLPDNVTGLYLPLSGGTVTGNTTITANLTVSGNSGINWFSSNTSSDLVRITQTGVGNAFVVEDNTNPDSTPFVIDASGNTGIGVTVPDSKLHISNTGTSPTSVSLKLIGTGTSEQFLFYRDGSSLINSTTSGSTKTINNGTSLRTFVNSLGFQFLDASGYGFHHTTNFGGLNVGNTNGFLYLWSQASDTLRLFLGGQDRNPTVARTRTVINPVPSSSTLFSPTGGTAIDYSFQNAGTSVFSPTGGTATYTQIELRPSYSGTGSYSGTVTGLLYNPNLLSMSGTTHRAIQTTTGDVIFGSTSGNVGIGTTSPRQRLDVAGNAIISSGLTAQTGVFSSNTQNILTVIGSGNSTTSPLFSVQGSSGELFSVTDSLTGSLFSVNDISGLPIMEVFSDNTTLWGSYQAPSLNTTTRTSLSAGTNTIYSIPTSAYTGAFYEYTLISTGTTGARAGQIMSIWSGTTAQFTETSTLDIGSTTGVTFTVAVSGNNAVLSSSATTAGWTVKTIIRSI